MDKNSQRINCLEKRKSISSLDKALKDISIGNQVMKLCENYKNVGIYISINDEVDTRKIIQDLLLKNVNVYVPKCVGNTLTFHRINGFEECAIGKFGLLEPLTRQVDLSLIELLIVPMVGFDDFNNRLGYGKGYYDSVLKHFECLKVGLAYKCTKVKRILIMEHDIPCDFVITEQA